MKRRTKGVEVFGESEAVEKLLYLVLVGLNERSSAHKVKMFAEIEVESHHITQIH